MAGRLYRALADRLNREYPGWPAWDADCFDRNYLGHHQLRHIVAKTTYSKAPISVISLATAAELVAAPRLVLRHAGLGEFWLDAEPSR